MNDVFFFRRFARYIRAYTQNTLSRQRFLFGFQRTKNDLPSQTAMVRSLASMVIRVERKGIEPLTPGLQSRCSPS